MVLQDLEGGKEACCGERLLEHVGLQTLEQREVRARQENRCGGGRAEWVPLGDSSSSRVKAGTVSGSVSRRTIPRRSLRRAALSPVGQDWPRDLQGLCSVSNMPGVKSFQRRRVAATPLLPLAADKSPALTFYLKSPLSLRRQQDLEKRCYQRGMLETWMIFLPPLGIYFVAEVSHLTSLHCFLVCATRLNAMESF